MCGTNAVKNNIIYKCPDEDSDCDAIIQKKGTPDRLIDLIAEKWGERNLKEIFLDTGFFLNKNLRKELELEQGFPPVEDSFKSGWVQIGQGLNLQPPLFVPLLFIGITPMNPVIKTAIGSYNDNTIILMNPENVSEDNVNFHIEDRDKDFALINAYLNQFKPDFTINDCFVSREESKQAIIKHFQTSRFDYNVS
jgi:hypothetical protein